MKLGEWLHSCRLGDETEPRHDDDNVVASTGGLLPPQLAHHNTRRSIRRHREKHLWMLRSWGTDAFKYLASVNDAGVGGLTMSELAWHAGLPCYVHDLAHVFRAFTLARSPQERLALARNFVNDCAKQSCSCPDPPPVPRITTTDGLFTSLETRDFVNAREQQGWLGNDILDLVLGLLEQPLLHPDTMLDAAIHMLLPLARCFEYVRACVVCIPACVRACVCVCVRACVCACVRANTAMLTGKIRLLSTPRRQKLLVHLEMVLEVDLYKGTQCIGSALELENRSARETTTKDHSPEITDKGGNRLTCWTRLQAFAAKDGLEIKTVVTWLEVWGLASFVQTLLPALVNIITQQKRTSARFNSISLDSAVTRVRQDMSAQSMDKAVHNVVDTGTSEPLSCQASVRAAHPSQTSKMMSEMKRSDGDDAEADVTRRVGTLLAKLACDGHLGLGVSVNFILQPLLSFLSSPVELGQEDVGHRRSEHAKKLNEVAGIISRIAQRLGEPTVGDAIVPRLVSLLVPASLAFPDIATPITVALGTEGSSSVTEVGTASSSAPAVTHVGKSDGFPLQSKRTDWLNTRRASSSNRNSGESAVELKSFDAAPPFPAVAGFADATRSTQPEVLGTNTGAGGDDAVFDAEDETVLAANGGTFLNGNAISSAMAEKESASISTPAPQKQSSQLPAEGAGVLEPNVASLELIVPVVLKLILSLMPVLRSDAALRALLAHREVLLRLLVDIPLRALQRRESADTPGLSGEAVIMAAKIVAGTCLTIGPDLTRKHCLGPISSWLLQLSPAYARGFSPGSNPLGLGGAPETADSMQGSVSDKYRRCLAQVYTPECIYIVYGTLWALIPSSESAVRVGEWRATLRQAIRHYSVFEALMAQHFGWTSASPPPLPIDFISSASSSNPASSNPPAIDRWASAGWGSGEEERGLQEKESASVVFNDGGMQWPFVGACSWSWKAYHGGPVKILTSHPLERVLLSAGKDATVRVWAPEGGTSCRGVYAGHREAVTDVQVVRTRDWVCSSDGEMHVFDLETQHTLHVLRGELAAGHQANFTCSLAMCPLQDSLSAGDLIVGTTAKYPGPVALKLFDLRAPYSWRALEWHLPPSVNDSSVLAHGLGSIWVGSTSGQL